MYRILRSIKNRFGSTAELGIYEMRQDGLRQVSNPSELLLSQDHEGMSGVAIASAIEGVRPFLIETQALVSSAVYGNPQRSATGFDKMCIRDRYRWGCLRQRKHRLPDKQSPEKTKYLSYRKILGEEA